MTDWIADHAIELFGAATGILYVFLEIRQNIWLWPLGLITSLLYIFVFFDSMFYADMGLQVYYLFISIYGWYWWSRGGDSSGEIELQVSHINFRLAGWAALIFTALFALIWLVLEYLTDSPIPGWDSFTTSLSIIATWMLARKYLEHWILWVIANIVSVGLYIFKGLYPTVVLFFIYTVMAVAGYIKWRRAMDSEGKKSSSEIKKV